MSSFFFKIPFLTKSSTCSLYLRFSRYSILNSFPFAFKSSICNHNSLFSISKSSLMANISLDSSCNFCLLFGARSRKCDILFTTKVIRVCYNKPETLFDLNIASLNSGRILTWKFLFITIIFSRSFILMEIQFLKFSLSFVWTIEFRLHSSPRFQSQSLSGIRGFRYFGK